MSRQEQVVHVTVLVVLLLVARSSFVELRALHERRQALRDIQVVRQQAAEFAGRLMRCASQRPLPEGTSSLGTADAQAQQVQRLLGRGQRPLPLPSQPLKAEAFRCAEIDSLLSPGMVLHWTPRDPNTGEISAQLPLQQGGAQVTLSVECSQQDCKAQENTLSSANMTMSRAL